MNNCITDKCEPEENYADKMLARSMDRISKYDTLDPHRKELQLWLDAKLMLNEVLLCNNEIKRLRDALHSALEIKTERYQNEAAKLRLRFR